MAHFGYKHADDTDGVLGTGATECHEGRARHVLLEAELLADLLERRHEKLVAHQRDRREHAAQNWRANIGLLIVSRPPHCFQSIDQDQ